METPSYGNEKEKRKYRQKEMNGTICILKMMFCVAVKCGIYNS